MLMRRADQLHEAALSVPIRVPAWAAAGLIAVQLGAAIGLTYSLGGTGRVAPHWFYFPILFAGLRYGPVGAIVMGVAGGLAAGPLMPLDVSAGETQPWTDWVSRMGFFVAVGFTAAVAFRRSVGALRREADQLRAEHELLAGVRRGELCVHYQPIVSLDTGRVVGAEAVVRWNHPVRGVLGPEEFLPLARERHLMGYVRKVVLSAACRDAASWAKALEGGGAEDLRVAVNLDAADLLDAGLLEDVAGALAASRIGPGRLCLEITETALIEDLERAVESLLALRLLGVCLSVDDFGTGYASFQYLRCLPVDEVKVDRSFVSELPDDAPTRAIVQSVIDLTRRLGKTTVAEGVESARQLAELVALGCDRAQGFYFSEPVAAPDLADLLRRPTVWPSRDVFAPTS